MIFGSADGRASCFDLSADPGEREDLSGASDDRCRKLERAVDSFRSTRPPTDRAETIEPSQEELRQLRALGYVD